MNKAHNAQLFITQEKLQCKSISGWIFPLVTAQKSVDLCNYILTSSNASPDLRKFWMR